MMDLLMVVFANPLFFIISLIAIAGMGGFVIDAVLKYRCLSWKHRERMAQFEAHKEAARALAAAPEKTRRSALAKELLAAYGEAGEGLRNDDKGTLERWETSTVDD